jgi:hypothetical protein
MAFKIQFGMNNKRPVNPLIGLQAVCLVCFNCKNEKLLPIDQLHDFVQIQGFGLLLDLGLVLWL